MGLQVLQHWQDFIVFTMLLLLQARGPISLSLCANKDTDHDNAFHARARCLNSLCTYDNQARRDNAFYASDNFVSD